MRRRKNYDLSFKRKAVELSYVRPNVRELAEEVGILPALQYHWRREHKRFFESFSLGRLLMLQ